MAVMNKLFDIFQNEKERIDDKNITLYYNKRENSLQYKHPEGTLTVLFDAQNGSERFFYKEAGKRIDESGKGLGVLVQETENNGTIARLPAYDQTQTAKLFDLPQELINVAQDYQFNRKEMGIELVNDKAVKTGKVTHNVERE